MEPKTKKDSFNQWFGQQLDVWARRFDGYLRKHDVYTKGSLKETIQVKRWRGQIGTIRRIWWSAIIHREPEFGRGEIRNCLLRIFSGVGVYYKMQKDDFQIIKKNFLEDDLNNKDLNLNKHFQDTSCFLQLFLKR